MLRRRACARPDASLLPRTQRHARSMACALKPAGGRASMWPWQPGWSPWWQEPSRRAWRLSLRRRRRTRRRLRRRPPAPSRRWRRQVWREWLNVLCGSSVPLVTGRGLPVWSVLPLPPPRPRRTFTTPVRRCSRFRTTPPKTRLRLVCSRPGPADAGAYACDGATRCGAPESRASTRGLSAMRPRSRSP